MLRTKHSYFDFAVRQLPNLDFASRCFFGQLILLLIFASAAFAQENSVVQMQAGYLFVDGEYLHPPYEIVAEENGIRVNDRLIESDYFDLAGSGTGGPPGREGRGPVGRGRGPQGRGPGRGPRFNQGANRGGIDPMNRLARQIDQVSIGALVVVYQQEKPVVLWPGAGGEQLLRKLLQQDVPKDQPWDVNSEEDRELLDQLVTEFQLNEQFKTRAMEDIKAIDDAVYGNERAAAANWWTARLAYPLTVFAMIAIVLAFGHLLNHRPIMEEGSTDSVIDWQILIKTLGLIACFSAIDLAWTLAASYAGTMHELNPLGSRLIKNPTGLIAFKCILTASSIAIFYCLRQKPIARVASWWCCLLLTLLTARWVVFQSMFS